MVKQPCGLKNLISIQSASACSRVLGGYGLSEKVVSLARKIPSEEPARSPTPTLVCSPQTAVNFGLQKEVKAISALVFSKARKLLDIIAQRHQGIPNSR